MLKVDVAQVVTRPVIIFMQAKAGNCVGDDASAGQGVVVGALKESLGWMRIGH
jgi:hypothetical protein